MKKILIKYSNFKSKRFLLFSTSSIQNSFYHSSGQFYNKSPDHPLNDDKTNNLNFEENNVIDKNFQKNINISNKPEKKLQNRFSVDTSGLIGYGTHQSWSKKKISKILSKNNEQNTNINNDSGNIDDDEYPQEEHKEPLTPLAKDLISYIQMRGPISLHDFMSQGISYLYYIIYLII
jgi:hypothetical protein